MGILITDGPVRISVISGLIAKAGGLKDAGGHSLFLGQVRSDVSDTKAVKAIEYSVFEKMAESEAGKIKAIIFSEFPDVRSVELVHSAGLVQAGEISLFVMISAGHRQQSVDACRKTVELIKQRLPVWKKEIFDDGTHKWQQNK